MRHYYVKLPNGAPIQSAPLLGLSNVWPSQTLSNDALCKGAPLLCQLSNGAPIPFGLIPLFRYGAENNNFSYLQYPNPRSMLWRCKVTEGIRVHTFWRPKEGNILANVVGVDSELRPPCRVEEHRRWRLPVNFRRWSSTTGVVPRRDYTLTVQ